MDAHLFRRFCAAAMPLLTGARLEKIQEAAPGVLTLTIFSSGRKRQLCLRFGRKEPFCFFTDARISATGPPSAMIMRLRKYASGRRIAACVLRFCERKLWLLMSGGQAETTSENPLMTWLLLDLREGASLHFLQADAMPVEELPLWPDTTTPRSANAANEISDANNADQADQWAESLGQRDVFAVLTPSLRRSLTAMEPAEQRALLEDLRVGGGDIFLYAEPSQGATAIDDSAHNTSGIINDTTDSTSNTAGNTAGDSAATAPLGEIRAVSAWPLPPALRRHLREESGNDVLRLIERAGQDIVLTRLSREAAQAANVPQQRKRRKLIRLAATLRAEEARLTKMCAAKTDALLLREHLWQLPADTRMPAISLPPCANVDMIASAGSESASCEGTTTSMSAGQPSDLSLLKPSGKVDGKVDGKADGKADGKNFTTTSDNTFGLSANADDREICSKTSRGVSSEATREAMPEATREIRLDPRRTVRENMEHLFHTARRGARGLGHLTERRAALEVELAALLGSDAGTATHAATQSETAASTTTPAFANTSTAARAPANLPRSVQAFYSSDGFILLRGRSAKGNLEARKYAAPHDLWLHIEHGPGAHVIIRRAHGGHSVPERTLDEAGALAACKSALREAARARILYAEVRHVKPLRHAPAGTVRMDKIFCSRDVPVDCTLEERLALN